MAQRKGFNFVRSFTSSFGTIFTHDLGSCAPRPVSVCFEYVLDGGVDVACHEFSSFLVVVVLAAHNGGVYCAGDSFRVFAESFMFYRVFVEGCGLFLFMDDGFDGCVKLLGITRKKIL